MFSSYDDMAPNYKTIYMDMILQKFPEKIEKCELLLSKNNLTALDIIKVNDILFRSHNSNQKHRAYKEIDIIKILQFQHLNKMSNSQLALHYKVSRNTITKWKKHFKQLSKRT